MKIIKRNREYVKFIVIGLRVTRTEHERLELEQKIQGKTKTVLVREGFLSRLAE